MAVCIDISNTTHRTFSPLNEKHNILYHRARHNVNMRHVKKPWFDLNPFLDRNNDKGIELEDYRPEHDTGIQPLESLAIVEDYFSIKPLMTKEFKIKEFWDFLFNEDWGDGYSIRILEGRLYDLMMSVIVNLIQSKSVVHHSTVAYAKNRRQIFNLYKHSEKKPTLGLTEETLLLEFIYYGHSTKSYVESDYSSLGYPATTTTCSTITNLTGLSSEKDSSETGADPTTPAIPSTYSQKFTKQTYSSSDQESLLREQNRLLKKRSLNQSETGAFTKPLINKSLPRVQEDAWAFPSRVKGISLQQTASNFSSGSDDYSISYVHPVDLTKFACTGKVAYLGDFDLSDESSCSSDDEATDFGQQLYLGDRSAQSQCKEAIHVSAEVKLKRKKESYRSSVQKWREQQRQTHEPKPLVPEFSELDVKKYLAKEKQNTTKDNETMPDEMPDLIQFIDILKRDEHIEETRRRKEIRVKMSEKKVKVTKPGNERFANEVGGMTDSKTSKLHCFQRDLSWRLMSDSAKRRYLFEKSLQSSDKVKDKQTKQKPGKLKKELEIPLVYITTTSGVTFLHPASMEHMNNEKRTKKNKTTGRRSPLVQNTTPLCQELSKVRRQKNASPTGLSINLSEEKIPIEAPKFPKAQSWNSSMESPDVESDVESDGLDDSVFNSTKLNVQYSLERIRQKKAQKKRANPNAKNIFTILKKYYRMKSILKAFSGPAPVRQKSSAASSRGSISSFVSKKRESSLINRIRQPPTIQDEKQEPKMTVGKLKWFPFLDARRQIFPPCNENDIFENYPMDKFRENLEKALDKFVVRREVVVSDYTAKASVSITFTKKYVFSKLILRNKFNQGGSSQLQFDMTRNLFPLFGEYTSRPESYFKDVKEACIMLNLNVVSALLLKELLYEALHTAKKDTNTLNKARAALSDINVFKLTLVEAELLLSLRTNLVT